MLTSQLVDAPLATEPVGSFACRNCGFEFGRSKPSFCASCGQDTREHAPTAWEFFHEFITHYVALEGKLWKTLLLLFFKPGELSKEFRAGRKVRYVAPLRLYITASFLFFLVVKVAGFGNLVTVNEKIAGAGSQSTAAPVAGVLPSASGAAANATKPAAVPEPALKARVVAIDCGKSDLLCQRLQHHLESKWQGKTNAETVDALTRGVLSNLPYAMFFMLPVFAWLTALVYRRRKFYFGEHMVYAMHVHAFAFFSLLAIALLPRWLGEWVWLLSLVYFGVALQRFFGGRWWVTVLRFALLGIVYPMLLVLMTGGVILISAIV